MAKAKTVKRKSRPAPPLKDPDRLTDGEQKCIQEYLTNGGNQSKAYRHAFPQSRRWKPETVWTSASKLFRQSKVQTRIAELQALGDAKAIVTDTQLLREVTNVALSDIRDLLDERGQFLPPAEWPERAAAAVSSVQVDHVQERDKNGKLTGHLIPVVRSIRMHNKMQAQEKLFRHLGLYERDNQQKAGFAESGFESLPEPVRDLILARLREIAAQPSSDRPQLAGPTDAIPGSTATH